MTKQKSFFEIPLNPNIRKAYETVQEILEDSVQFSADGHRIIICGRKHAESFTIQIQGPRVNSIFGFTKQEITDWAKWFNDPAWGSLPESVKMVDVKDMSVAYSFGGSEPIIFDVNQQGLLKYAMRYFVYSERNRIIKDIP